MSSETNDAVRASPAASSGRDRKWWGLTALASAQLMVTLDATIMVIALPSAQQDVGLGDAGKQWVFTAYALTLGGLLLLGGRIGDLIGRRRALLIGVLGFAAASALGGAATNPAMLITARALQGAFAAVLSPSTLSLVSVMFTEAKARARAFAIFSVTLISGGAVGMILGGILTSQLSWRWCMYVNLPIAALVVAGALKFVPRTKPVPGGRLDLVGVLLIGAGLTALVYALGEAELHGWGSPLIIGLLAASVVLLAVFAFWQTRAAHPLLPLRILADRARIGANLAIVTSQFAVLGMFLFMTYQLQSVMGYPALEAGLAFLPFVVVSFLVSTQLTARLLTRVAPWWLIAAGLLMLGIGDLLFTRLTPDSSYAGLLLPALLVFGAGSGLLIAPVMSSATRVDNPADAGVASALIRTSQQIGGALGAALLNTVAVAYTAASQHEGPLAAAVHGYTASNALAAAVLLAGAVCVVLLRPRRQDVPGDRIR
ncbi:MFS transporter [Amycolatopsis nigrescens]|uniref:MFS transporter n=1 Tax=Amycolatopsis nigrescens TaxID=381445 RepID=UPI00037D13C1|nr:MFS transporter [Amycolatopsis nigrescens]